MLLGDLIATHHTNYNGDGNPDLVLVSKVRRHLECRSCFPHLAATHPTH
ncbi:MAG: hypothetical protein HC789_12680 [Microcoleus sp. CSU_2_2]|nr:hypothetical protein [Microcoleus sp. CSU_2_2]